MQKCFLSFCQQRAVYCPYGLERCMICLFGFIIVPLPCEKTIFRFESFVVGGVYVRTAVYDAH